MPRFFIDTDDGDFYVRDEEGQDYPDAAAARVSALHALSDIARDTIPVGDSRTYEATIRNDQGAVVYVAKLTFTGRWA